MILEGLLILLFIVYIGLLFYPDVATRCENYIVYNVPQYLDTWRTTSPDGDSSDEGDDTSEDVISDLSKTSNYTITESNLSADLNQYDLHTDQYLRESPLDEPSYDFAPTLQHYRSIDPDAPQSLINFTSGLTNSGDEYVRNSTQHDVDVLDRLESAIPHSYDLQLESFTNPELVALDNALRTEGEVLHRKPQYNEFLKGSRNSDGSRNANGKEGLQERGDKVNDDDGFDQYLQQGQKSKFVIPNKLFLTPYSFENDEYSNKATYNATIDYR